MFNLRDISILYHREIRSALRERNIIFNTILMPVFLYPMLLWVGYTGITFVFGQTEGFVSKVAVDGATDLSSGFQGRIEIDERLELVMETDPEDAVKGGKVDLLVTILPTTDSLQGNFEARLTYDASRDRSASARTRVTEILDQHRTEFMQKQAKRLGLSISEYQKFWVETKNVATEQQMGRFVLGLLIPMLLVVMVGVGSMYAAIDATAGEREKSTWETLMTSATDRVNIIASKYLYVVSIATIAGLLNFTAMIVSMKSILAPLLGDRIETMSFSVPWMSVPLVIVVTLLLSLFIAAGMMILASFARTFREAQSMISPFYLMIILPVMFLQIPGIEFSITLALIPIVNVCMVFREAVMGHYQWPQIFITIGIEALCIAACLWMAAFILRYEEILIGSYEGNLMKFLRERVLGRKTATEESQ